MPSGAVCCGVQEAVAFSASEEVKGIFERLLCGLLHNLVMWQQKAPGHKVSGAASQTHHWTPCFSSATPAPAGGLCVRQLQETESCPTCVCVTPLAVITLLPCPESLELVPFMCVPAGMLCRRFHTHILSHAE